MQLLSSIAWLTMQCSFWHTTWAKMSLSKIFLYLRKKDIPLLQDDFKSQHAKDWQKKKKVTKQ
jgi:uncharacterized FlgJ-related protein